jgi:hypothetical protein
MTSERTTLFPMEMLRGGKNIRRTQSLFWEFKAVCTQEPIMTLALTPKGKLPSIDQELCGS